MRLLNVLLLSLVLSGPLLAAGEKGEVLIAIADPLLLAPRQDAPQAADDALAGVLVRHDLRARWLVPATARHPLARRYVLLRGAGDPAAARDALAAVPGVAAAMVNGTRSLFWVPNDPGFFKQWYLQPGHSAGSGLAEAWDLGTGGPDVLIAIVDTGVDWSHADLAANIWSNPGEIQGNGLDDDGNGFSDDIFGWDCGGGDWDARPEPYFEMGLDVGWHGTHCAGIAAAATDNAIGIAGAAPHSRIMPLKITDSAGQITDAAIATAFIYAIQNGADIISMSFGGPGDGGADAFYQDLVDQALAADVVCVAAAGNNNNASLMYPAACAGVISVGATDASGQRASYSTYGSWVTVNAPGSQIWSTVQSNYSWDWLSRFLYMLSYGYDGSNPYMYADGTSMACPLVAGICSLILHQSPALQPAGVRQLLLDSGQDVTYDQPLGVKVDAHAALLALAMTPAPLPPAARALFLQAVPNPFNPRTELRLELANEGTVTVTVHDLRGGLVRTLLDGVKRPSGRLRLGWDGRDAAGRDLPSGLYLARVTSSDQTATAKLILAR